MGGKPSSQENGVTKGAKKDNKKKDNKDKKKDDKNKNVNLFNFREDVKDTEYKDSRAEESKKVNFQHTFSGTEENKAPVPQENQNPENRINTEEERQRKIIEEQKRNVELDDLLELSKGGKLKLIQSIFKKGSNEIIFVKGLNERIQLFNNDYTTSRWNPFNFAVYYGHLEVVQFYCEELKGKINSHHFKGDSMYFHVNASQYKVEADDDYLNKPNHRLESFWFTIHNKDIDTFKYLWNIGCQFFNSSIIIKVLRRITENEWRDAMQVVMRSSGTKVILSNLNTKMLDKLFQDLKEPIMLSDYLTNRGPEDYLKIYEDEVETLEQEMELINQDDIRDRAFYSQDLLTASGTGNLDVIKDIFSKYKINQLSNINGCRDISDTILRVNSYVYKDTGYVYKEERMNPMTLALVKNQTEVVEFYLENMPDLHLMYSWRKPSGSMISFIDYYNIRDEVFPLICAIYHRNLKLLDMLFTKYQNYN